MVEKVNVREDKKPKKFLELLNLLSANGHKSKENESVLWEAYNFARNAHKGQKRKSGEPYFEHCYSVAKILAEIGMDTTTVIGGLLHDVMEDTGVTYEEIARKFGEDVARLVEGVTKISGIRFLSKREEQADNFRKLLISVAEDIRVIIIKLADRLHNMQTIQHLPAVKQMKIAMETRDVYAPIAHRLGMYKIKSELEDLVLRALDYDAYRYVRRKVKTSRKALEDYIERFSEPIRKALKEQGIPARIFGRPKNFYSIYRKMQIRHKSFEEIYDVMAIRIVTDTKENCYYILGIVHNIYPPIMERFKDYIANPKANRYQSIHTTVHGPEGKVVEVQIRTEEMDLIAEEGVAAHWRYKEAKDKPDELDKYVSWLRDLVEVLKSETNDAREFLETLKIDLFKDEIFVFTPKGDLIRLPKGATPVDFAFAVHTEIGYRCIGAKVDGRIVPLNTQLRSGQTIEILTSENQRPSYAWLKFVKTGKAISAIKRWLRKIQQDESIRLGKEILEKEDKRHRDIQFLRTVQESCEELGFSDLNKLYEAVGSGVITVHAIYSRLFPHKKEEIEKEDFDRLVIHKARRSVKGVKIQGVSNIMVSFARCCNPIPGDDIIGFISRGRGIIVHRSDCRNIPAMIDTTDRIIDVEWDVSKGQEFIVPIKILAQERKNLLRDITEAISNTNTNIAGIEGKVDDTLAIISLLLQVGNLEHLNKVIDRIFKIPGIINVERR